MAELVKILDEKLKKSPFLRREGVKGEAPVSSGRKAVCRLYRMRGYCALFVFSFSGAAPGVRNFLECRIYEHEKDLLYIPLSKLTGMITEGYRYLEYPYIATEEQMAGAMDELLSALEELTPAITAFFSDRSMKDQIYFELVEEANRYCGEKVLDYNGTVSVADEEVEQRALLKMLRFFYSYRVSGMLVGPFAEFLCGRPLRAQSGLAANRRPDGETVRLVATPQGQVVVSDLQKRLFSLYKRQNGLMVLPALFLSVAGCTLLLAPLLTLFCGLIYYASSGGFDPEVLTHTARNMEQFAYLAAPLLLSGLLWLCFDVRPLFFLLYGKRSYKDYAATLHTGFERRITGVVGAVLLALLITLSVLTGRLGVVFTENYFVDQNSFFSLESVNYTYDKIEQAALIGGRYSSAQDALMLVLKDGRVVDLYGRPSRAQLEGQILPLLEDKGVKIEKYADMEAFFAVYPHLDPKNQAESPESGENK